MSKSCDVVIDEKFTVHLSIIPHLGLIIVNDVDDFAESWLEINVVEDCKYRLKYDVRTIAGFQTDGVLEAAGRFLIDSLYNRLYKRAGPDYERIGSLLKFTLNLNLRREIIENRGAFRALGAALGSLLTV